MVGDTISVWMDDVMISYPTVNEAHYGWTVHHQRQLHCCGGH